MTIDSSDDEQHDTNQQGAGKAAAKVGEKR